MSMADNRVIVSGAGPVGAVMTLALVKQGIPVTLIEQLPDAAEDQRAATIHPPTVDMLVKLGLEKEMFSTEPTGGMEAPLFHFRDRATGKLIAVFDISLLKGEVPYPYVVQWEQYKLVHAALPYIKASGLGEVRFSTKLTGLAQTADHVEATVTNAAGESETLRGKYLIGSDGGSSTVRRLAEIAFSVNERTENIGARRLHTVMEKLLEEVSFDAGRKATRVTIDAAYVDDRLGALAKSEDLARYVL